MTIKKLHRKSRKFTRNGLAIVLTSIITLTGTSILPTAALSADAKHGEKLYTEKCGGCHDTRVHTRPNRIVHTFDDLVNRVKFCDTNAKTNFSDSDILDISEYLNNEFYKFLKIDS